MAYCTIAEVRLITGITSDQVSDDDLTSILTTFSQGKVNADIAIEWKEERIQFISNEKENKQDSSNTTFYVINTPLCDLDDDGDIDTSDIEVYSLDSSGTRSVLTVSAVDSDPWLGQFTLSAAPTGAVDLFIKRYRSAPVETSPTTHPLVKEACALVTGMRALMKIEGGQYGSWRVGKISVTKRSPAFNILKMEYEDVISRIVSAATELKSPSNARPMTAFPEGFGTRSHRGIVLHRRR